MANDENAEAKVFVDEARVLGNTIRMLYNLLGPPPVLEPPPEPRVRKRDMHTHICPHCLTRWMHDGNKIRTEEQRKEAHTCKTCGTEQYDRYDAKAEQRERRRERRYE